MLNHMTMAKESGKQLSNKIILLTIIISPIIYVLIYPTKFPDDLYFYDYENSGLEYSLDPWEITLGYYLVIQALLYSTAFSMKHSYCFILSILFLAVAYFFMLFRGNNPTINYPLWGTIIFCIYLLLLWLPTIKHRLSSNQ
jgi:hypothetical protein